MENPIKLDDLGETHYFRKHPYMAIFGLIFKFATRSDLVMAVTCPLFTNPKELKHEMNDDVMGCPKHLPVL